MPGWVKVVKGSVNALCWQHKVARDSLGSRVQANGKDLQRLKSIAPHTCTDTFTLLSSTRTNFQRLSFCSFLF